MAMLSITRMSALLVVMGLLLLNVSSTTIECAYDLNDPILGDVRYGLEQLSRKADDPYRVYRGSTSFSFNVCKPVSNCGANLPSAACKSTSLGGMETALGSEKSLSVHRLTQMDITFINQQTGHQPQYDMTNGGQGIKLVYPAIQSYGAAGVEHEAVTIMVPCDSTARFAVPLRFVQGAKYETAAEGFIFVLPSVYGCPTNKPLPDMGEEPLSFGWVFIILLSVVLTLYCGVGMGYKMHKYGVRGIEAVPHVDFWRELPLLIKDGYYYFTRRISECGGGGEVHRVSAAVQGNAYDTVL